MRRVHAELKPTPDRLHRLRSRFDNPNAIPAPIMCRGRFARSPAGSVGCSRAAGGAWIVRMEGLDHEREVTDPAVDILATLDTFGFESDERVMY